MTREEAKLQISKAVNDYDTGRITLPSLYTVIGETIDQVAQEFYEKGADDIIDGEDEDDEWVEFEADFDLDDFRDDDDDL